MAETRRSPAGRILDGAAVPHSLVDVADCAGVDHSRGFLRMVDYVHIGLAEARVKNGWDHRILPGGHSRRVLDVIHTVPEEPANCSSDCVEVRTGYTGVVREVERRSSDLLVVGTAGSG